MFRNGREWRGWYRGDAPALDDPSPGALTLTVDGSKAGVSFKAEHGHHADLRVHIALLGMGLKSRITGGENRGRTLAHDFVVLGIVSAPLAAASTRYSTELTLPEPGVDDARRLAVAAWVSAANRQAPIQAAGGFLER